LHCLPAPFICQGRHLSRSAPRNGRTADRPGPDHRCASRSWPRRAGHQRPPARL